MSSISNGTQAMPTFRFFLASTPIGTGADTETLTLINGITLPSANQTFTVNGSFSAEPIIHRRD